MSLERIVIRIGSALLLALGLACALIPEVFAEAAGISATAAGLTDFRAVYAGAQIALGGFLFWCDRDPALHTAGLVALLFFLSDIAIVRGIGLMVDGELAAYQLVSLTVELAAALVVGAVLMRGQARVPQAA